MATEQPSGCIKIDGQLIPMVERKCAGGCGQKFKVMAGSPSLTASVECTGDSKTCFTKKEITMGAGQHHSGGGTFKTWYTRNDRS